MHDGGPDPDRLAAARHHSCDGSEELVGVYGLLETGQRSQVRRQHFGVSVTAQKNNRPVLPRHNVGDRGDVLTAKVDVEQRDVEGDRGHQCECGIDVRGFSQHGAPGGLQEGLEAGGNRKAVFDDDDARSGGAS